MVSIGVPTLHSHRHDRLPARFLLKKSDFGFSLRAGADCLWSLIGMKVSDNHVLGFLFLVTGILLTVAAVCGLLAYGQLITFVLMDGLGRG